VSCNRLDVSGPTRTTSKRAGSTPMKRRARASAAREHERVRAVRHGAGPVPPAPPAAREALERAHVEHFVEEEDGRAITWPRAVMKNVRRVERVAGPGGASPARR
jgi:hypothetical protein